ncbi:MAG: hypothetical protein FWC01_07055 [Treponema sp.]|nr:hypothetical protein [Treponema sp.]MCL2237812.1 hypothetical protein [Treponema sp.]
MSSFRWGLIAALVAVFISVSLGILFGVNPIHIFIRAVIFGVIFFGFGFGLRFLINNFFPEVLSNEDESISSEYEQSGQQVDITLDGSGEYAVPELYRTPGDPQEMGNIEDLISGAFRPRRTDDEKQMPAAGIDAGIKTGYNGMGGIQDTPIPDDDNFQDLSVFDKTPAEKPAAAAPQFTPSFGDDSGEGLGGLPDLDMMARAFSSYGGAPDGTPEEISMPMPALAPMAPPEDVIEEPPPRQVSSGNKPQALEGDFDPKSLAEGIRTVLSKD